MRITLLLTALLAACSSATAGGTAGATAQESGKCAAAPGDTLYTQSRPAYRDCAVTTKVSRLASQLHPDWTPPRDTREACFSVEMEYVVDENGYVEMPTAHIVRSNTKELADAFMALLPQYRFRPATLNGTPVRQIVVDKNTVETARVAVPANSPMPSRPPASSRMAKC